MHILSQFMQAPKEEHIDATRRVVRYIKGTAGQGLFLPKNSKLELVGYYDSDWGACPITRQSLTGYFIKLGNSPISWKTKKQNTVSRSSPKAKYRSLTEATSELIWLRSFLASLGFFLRNPTPLFCDNQLALHIANNPVFHERTKHNELYCHFAREKL